MSGKGLRPYQAIYSQHCSRYHFLHDTLFQLTDAAATRDCRMEHVDAIVNEDSGTTQRKYGATERLLGGFVGPT
jgi:hypothetical protein